LRLREITELLQGQAAASRLLDPAEVNALIDRFQARSGAPTATR
jgi:hypothetical protein